MVSKKGNITRLFDFDKFVDRQGSFSFKWDRYKGRDIIPMWVADMDFQSPPSVIKALHARVEHGVFGYTLAPDELVEAVLSMCESDFNWKIKKEWLVWLPGLVTGLNVACRAVGEHGDDVLTLVPVYPPFLTAPENMHRNLVTVPLAEKSGKWVIDFDLLENAITPRTRLFILCNPHNPVGRVFDHRELSRLALICKKNDIIVCSDEIHCQLVLDKDKKHIPFAALGPDVCRSTITFMAPSKTFNIPGLGCSFAVISDSGLRKKFHRAMAGIVPMLNTFAYTAALAAYRGGKDWHRSLLDYLRENHDYLYGAVNKIPGLSMSRVEATYLAWIKISDAKIDDPVKFFEKAGVGLSDGREFMGPGFVRLNFGCSRSVLQRAVSRMEAAQNKKIL